MAANSDDDFTLSEEIEILEGKITTISADLGVMKDAARRGKKISLEDLDLTVSDINRLDVLMRRRRDRGH